MIRIGKKEKKIVVCILLFWGMVFSGLAIHSIVFAGQRNEQELNLDAIKSLDVRKVVPISPIFYNPLAVMENKTFPSDLQEIDIMLSSLDTIAEGSVIDYEITGTIVKPESVSNMYLVLAPANYPDISIPTPDNLEGFVDYEKKLGAIIELKKENFLQFYAKNSIGLPEGDYGLYVILKTVDNQIQYIPLKNKEMVFHVKPYSEWLQINTNRVTIAQVEQYAIDNKEQRKSNDVMEGLTYILVAWIFFDPAFRLWSSLKNNSENPNAYHDG